MTQRKKVRKPISKKVVALNEQLQRRRGIRDLPKRFLIVCEDDKSAVNYFEALKKNFGLTATSINVVGSSGRTQPIQVVNRAIEIKTNADNPDCGTEPFDYVWCIIDGDYEDKINNARRKAIKNDIKIAISNKCFEYWILLHFEEYDTSAMDCSEVVRVLKSLHIPDYDKGKCIFNEIVKNVHNAKNRAKKLRAAGINRGENPEVQNPCSEVYLLIEAIVDEKANSLKP